ncbi:hypothetical protein VN97_g3895 [Penicillium thymicola]|uniref:Uncharacterized protein n=1 Tax=Penicillium thymicola TaxID=293382 RepID=A0AAI9TLN5_PENTH|nr:hypothetical protein VN97_g3895 [Penicillium thymicola]
MDKLGFLGSAMQEHFRFYIPNIHVSSECSSLICLFILICSGNPQPKLPRHYLAPSHDVVMRNHHRVTNLVFFFSFSACLRLLGR